MKKLFFVLSQFFIFVIILVGCGKKGSSKWLDPTYTWSSDFKTCKAVRILKNDETKEESETVNSSYSIITQVTCENDGVGRYIAEFTNKAFTTQSKDVTIEKIGHNYEFDSFAWTGNTAKAKYICTNDNTHIKEYDATVSCIVKTEATCEADGLGDYTATYDGHTETKELIIPSFGHNYEFDSFVWTGFTAKVKYVCSHDNTHIQYDDADVTSEITKEAECETDGIRTYTAKYITYEDTKEEVIPAIGHNYGNITYTWATDYSTCTASRTCQNDNTHIESETVNSTRDNISPTYYADGKAIFTATFTNTAFEEQTYELTIKYNGEIPVIDDSNNFFKYGLYPKNHVNDNELITILNGLTTPEANGWYLYNDTYYAKLVATPLATNYKFTDGTSIVSGTTYWFKCEPIIWQKVSNYEGRYYLVTIDSIDNYSFYSLTETRIIDEKTIYPNNYEFSDIRSWLNGDFYNIAFSLGNTYIKPSAIQNGAETTENNTNPYACNDTLDNVFLPSYKDYTNEDYPISSSGARYAIVTDWAKARGAHANFDSTYVDLGYYWTRSPGSENGDGVSCINDDTTLIRVIAQSESASVRPAIVIDFSDNN